MVNTTKKFNRGITTSEGIVFEPIDLPTGLVEEGMVFFSDGTTLPVGLHQRQGSSWVQLAAQAPTPRILATHTATDPTLTIPHNIYTTFAPPTIVEQEGITYNTSGFSGYIVAEAGFYCIKAGLLLASTTAWDTGEIAQLVADVYDSGGTLDQAYRLDRMNGVDGFNSVTGSISVPVPAGGSIRFRIIQTSDVSIDLHIASGAFYNYVSISKED